MSHRRLNIAVVANNIKRGDGQGRVTLEIISALLDRGHEVSAFSITCDDSLLGREGFDWRKVSIPDVPDIVAIVLFATMATRAVNRSRWDVVFTMGPCAFPDAPSAYYAPFTQVGWRASWARSGKPDLLRRIQTAVATRLESRAVPRAKTLLPTSVDIALELSALTSPTTTVRIIPGGVSLAEFGRTSPDKRRDARAKLGFSDEDFVMVMVGEYATGRKGLDRLAVALAAGGDRREKLLVKGAGPQASTMERLTSLGLGDRVRLIPPEDGDVSEALAAADAAVVLSLYEPFSLVLLEAAASGLPVIASSSVGAADYIGEAALRVDPSDVSSVRRAIELLRDDLETRLQLGSVARRHAEIWTWDHISQMAADSIEETSKI